MQRESSTNQPTHIGKGKLEVIQAIEGLGLGYAEGCILKYITEYRFKGKPLEDLKQARWHLDRLIQEFEAKRAEHLQPVVPKASKKVAKGKNHKVAKPAGVKLCLVTGCTKRPKRRGPYTGFCTTHGQGLKAEERKKLRAEAEKKNSKPAEAPAQ